MAKSATKESVSTADRLPAYKAVLAILRVEMKKKKDRIAGINGEINDLWGRVEGHKVDKLGAKLFMMMDKLEPDERQSAMRTFDELADIAGWPEYVTDLVDQAEDKEVPMRTSRGAETVEQELDEIEKQQDQAEAQKPKTPAQAKAAAARHLRAVESAPAPAADDDSDLAGD